MYSPAFIRRFLNMTEKSEDSDCTLWWGGCDKDGYGTIKHEGRTLRAHRVAFEIAKGPVPPGLVVMHSCDNPQCVNTKHLSAGTIRDNNRDMMRKGRNRAVKGSKKQRGILNARSKITSLQAVRIRVRASQGESQEKLAKEYGVSQTTISKIIRRELWRHV